MAKDPLYTYRQCLWQRRVSQTCSNNSALLPAASRFHSWLHTHIRHCARCLGPVRCSVSSSGKAEQKSELWASARAWEIEISEFGFRLWVPMRMGPG